MSKLIDLYNKCKKEDNAILYCFKNGSFYNFFNEDANKVSEILNLKITKFSENGTKCGFPINSKENKFEKLNVKHISYKIIELKKEKNIKKTNLDKNETIIKDIKELDLSKMTDREAFIKLCEYQVKLRKI